MNVVLGASGCVGKRLLKRLVARREPVRALVRRYRDIPEVEVVKGDLLRPETLETLFRGATTVYFLAHAMGSQEHGKRDVERDDRAQARNAFQAAKEQGSPRIVYVSGLGATKDAPSAHLRGRWAVEDEAHLSGLPWSIFQAGVLLGPESVGWEFLLQVVKRAIIPLPAWADTVMQPFALADLLDALVRAGREEAFLGKTIQLGTKDRTTYAELLERAAKAMGFEPTFVRLPLAFQPMAGAALAFAADAPLSTGFALAESLTQAPFVVDDGGAGMRDLGIPVRELEDALRLGLRDTVAERVA